MVYLEILIPTYNRPIQFTHCLISIIRSILILPEAERSKIGISVRNNSSKSINLYKKIIKKYSKVFKNYNLAYFKYSITGINIGSPKNIWHGFKNVKAKYVWVLPDDDIARFDSLHILIKTLKNYNPSFIYGGCKSKSYIKKYNSNQISNDDNKKNKILDITYKRNKIRKFLLSGNTVQLQEYVYKSDIVKKFLKLNINSNFIHDMTPGIIAIYSLHNNKGPLIRFNKSIGIFRHGNDHQSDWRHLWWKFALIDWPIFSKKMYEKKWLNIEVFKISQKVFTHILKNLCWRLDILLGLNFRCKINPFLLYKFHGYNYVFTLIKSPFAILYEIPKRILINFIK